MMLSAYKLNKQGDNIRPWYTPFPIVNQLVVPCLVLTVASWPEYTFLRRQVRWSGVPTPLRISQFVTVIHTVKGVSVVSEAEVDVFLEFPWFLYDPIDAGNLTSGSSAFSKPSFYIWKFLVPVILKDFEYNLASMWIEHTFTMFSLNILWHCASLGLEWTLTFSRPVTTAEFFKFAHILSAAL